MTGKVIAFPGCEPPPEPECSCPEGSPNPGCEVQPRQETPTFLDWAYVEVVDFCQWAEDLVEVAEAGQEQFWRRVAMLRDKINGWTPP